MKRITPDSPELKSADLVAENIERLRELFPEAFANEGKIDFDVLRQLLGDRVDDGEERYGLNWHGKRAARQIALTPSTGTLRPCPEESVDWESTQNLFIEGDNLEVLKLLQKSYAGKVKLIYIDPPYNTGKDFVYPDNFQDSIKNYLEITGQVEGGQRITSNTEASGRFHTDWLNMMYPRLKLARQLLTKDGMLFISIDDNESHTLRCMLDSIYGEENFVAVVVWNHTKQSKNDERYFSRHHNTLLVYRRSEDAPALRMERTEQDNANYSNPDNDPRGDWRPGDVRSPHLRPNLRFDITTPSGGRIAPPENGWRWKQETVLEKIGTGEIVFSADESRIIRKIYLAEQDGRTPENLWLAEDAGTTRQATQELKELFDGDSPFDTPKPTSLITRILTLCGMAKEDIVLDFFAGSATTGDSCLRFAAAQDAPCRFVLVQLPEPMDRDNADHQAAISLCRAHTVPENLAEVAKERLRRVRAKLLGEHSRTAADLGFRVYKLDTGIVRPWEASRSTLTESLTAAVDHVKPDRTEDDLLYDMVLKHGLDLCAAIEEKQIGSHKVRSAGGGAIFACFGSRIMATDVERLADGIAKWRDELAPANPELCRVIFRDSAFETDVAKTNLALILKERGFDERLVVSL